MSPIEQRIIVGDCLRVLPDRSCVPLADVVVNSPPYNIGVEYRTYSDRMPDADYLDHLVAVFAEVKRSMKPDASIFLNVGTSNLKPWLPLDLAMRLRELFVLQNRLTWIKSIATDLLGSTGQFKPVNSDRFLTLITEDIFHFTLTGDVRLNRLAIGVPYADKSNLARHNKSQSDPTVPKQDRRDRGNAWFIPYETVQNRTEKYNHPAGFPIDLPRWCISLHGKVNAAVLDPFAGTGTTLLAAHLEGCRGFGIELDERYCDIAHQRLTKAGAAVSVVNPTAEGLERIRK